MSTLWWRGEAVGDKPIPPDKTADHDIGDGLYLADTKEGGIAYTMQRTSDPAARRLYSVRIDTSQMRVLDLTTDARWLKNIKAAEPFIRQANSNYNRVFQEFIKTNNIRLEDFDAVIGVDYAKGGKQMCILYKNGAPTRLQTLLRSNFISEGIATEPPMDSTSIAKRLPTGGDEEGGGGGGAGGGGFGQGLMIVGVGLFALAAQLIGSWLFQLEDDSLTNKQFRGMEPAIDQEIKKHSAMVALLQSTGKKAYANITVRIDRGKDYSTPVSAETGAPIDQYAVVHLESVFVSGDNVNIKQRTETRRGFGSEIVSTYYTYSAEVALTKLEVYLFVAVMTEYKYYDAAVKMSPTDPTFRKQLSDVRQKIVQMFGQYAEMDVLDDWWPTFKYKGTPVNKDN